MQVIAGRVGEAAPFDGAPVHTQDRETWAELCRWGGAAIGVLCLTASVAALILALLEHV